MCDYRATGVAISCHVSATIVSRLWQYIIRGDIFLFRGDKDFFRRGKEFSRGNRNSLAEIMIFSICMVENAVGI